MKILNPIQRLSLHLLYLCSFLYSTSAFSQVPIPTSSENYIMNTEYITRTGNPDSALYSIAYFDGLGRPKQTIQVKASPTGNDMLIHYEYDGFGRQTKDYLPVRTGLSNGKIVTDPISKYNAVYNSPSTYNTQVYYSEKEIENSPLNRVMKQAAPGDDWELGSGNEIKFQYEANTGADAVKRYTAGTGWSSSGPTLSTTYPEGMLYKTTTTDENGNSIHEFKNKSGQVVLKRTWVTLATTAGKSSDPGNPPTAAPVKADTYYVYDIYGNLTYVIPPLAAAKANIASATLRSDLCFQYKYDERNRLVEKKLPGKGWEFMVYDKQDRLVATQDIVMRPAGNWLFTKYDKFGRVVYTGIYNGGANRATVQQAANTAANNNNENRQGSIGFTKNGLGVYYTTTAFPTGFTELHSVNYYDSYANVDFPKQSTLTVPPNLRDGTSHADKSTKSMALVSHVRVLSTDTWEKTLTRYDIKSRPVLTLKANHLGGYTETVSTFNFRGQPTQVDLYHKRSNLTTDSEVKTVEKFTYDTQGRLTRHTHKINAKAEEVLALNTYDQFGQLSSKKVGGTNLTGANRLQQVDYKYNIRGWLTDINDVNSSLIADRAIPGPGQSDKLFAFHINYNTLSYDQGITVPAQKLYNGNISQTFWKSSTDDKLRGYSYQYDQLNRLRNATFTKVSLESSSFPGVYDENIAYDLNGNILSLNRYTGDANENPIGMDELTYTYQSGNTNSNRLLKVTDAVTGSGTGGFVNGSSGTSNDYTYDENGNMLSDLNKGITEIIYNHLNLPEYISFGNGNVIEYIYNAAGVKVKKSVSDPSANTVKFVDYLDGFQYAGEVLQFFPTSEGYVSATPGSTTAGGTISYIFNYVYNYTDHLGNIRMSYTKDPVNGQLKIMEENHYYPFGLKHEVYADAKQMYQLVENLENTARPTFVYKTDYQYKYQGQERQDELGLNWDSFKWRNYDYAIARFMSVDPLAEGYEWQSVYVFGSNQPVHAKEIEGLESADDKSLFNRALSWGTDYAKEMWSTPGQVVESVANSNAVSQGLQAIGEGEKILDAFNEGGLGAAVGQYGQSVYETSGAKAVVGTVKGAANGNGGDAAKVVKTVVTAVVAKKVTGQTKTSTTVSQNASKEASARVGGNIPKPGTGKGKVAPENRDPKRVLTTKEKTELISERGGKCEGCNKDVDTKTSDAHHTIRHSDGGPTTKENTNILCKDCHKQIHKP